MGYLWLRFRFDMTRKYSVIKFQQLVERLREADGTISFLDSVPGEDEMPLTAIKNMGCKILVDNQYGFNSYGSAQGEMILRQEIASFFLQNYNLKDNIIITAGSQQGLSLVSSFLRRKIKRELIVAVEDPTYIGFKHIIETQGGRCFPVSMEKDGLNLDELEDLIKRKKINVLYVIPDFQNPTGIVLSEKKRKLLVKIAKKNNLYIIEDLAYRWLSFDKEPNLPPTLSQLYGKVFSVGSFSKIISPGIRVGWLLSPGSFTQDLVAEKQALELSQPSFFQILLANLIIDGSVKDHLKYIRRINKLKRDFMNYCLEQNLPDSFKWDLPKGGFSFWIKAPPMVNTKILLEKALRHKIAFGPGEIFSVGRDKNLFFRLSFCSVNLDQIETGIKRLSRAVRELYGQGGLENTDRPFKNLGWRIRYKLINLPKYLGL